MADYIYLLENRLSPAQRSALRTIREIARSKALTVFLVGGAVRDLTSGSPVRDLDVVVQGNALKLKKELEKAGAIVTGEHEATQSLYLRFTPNTRVEVSSTISVSFPKPGKPVIKPATILDDLRRRDFTANAMALSLNEGSYGLLMDPLNGVADIENRELRLVSNYGFIEDPVRMIRAARFMARLGWTMDEKTQGRYDTGKEEGYISVLSDFHRGYETEEIVYEEDPLRVLKRLEDEGWMKNLAPFWTTTKVNATELEKLRDAQGQLQVQGIHADSSAASFPLLTAKLSAKEIATLKGSFVRPGFVHEIESIESDAKEFATQLGGKAAASPSQAWRLITSGRPELVLSVAYSTRSPTLQAKFKSFYTEWPQARQKMPFALMQEMRISPDLPAYEELLEKVFFELMDGKLLTTEEMKAFLEPYSPPAPPPPVSARRVRAVKKDAKPAKSRSRKAVKSSEDAESDPPVEDGLEHDADDDAAINPPAPKTPEAEVLPPPSGSGEAVSVTKPKDPKKASTSPAVPKAASTPPAKTVPEKKTANTPKPTPTPGKTPTKAVAAKVPAPAAKSVETRTPARPAAKVAPPAKKAGAKVAAKAPAKAAAKKSPHKTSPAKGSQQGES